jgi:hypothetical protein
VREHHQHQPSTSLHTIPPPLLVIAAARLNVAPNPQSNHSAILQTMVEHKQEEAPAPTTPKAAVEEDPGFDSQHPQEDLDETVVEQIDEEAA